MRKNLKRIATLALTLVLICTCAATAFALTDTVDETIGDNYVFGSASITKLTVSGATEVDGPAPTGYNRSVNVAYTYYPYNYTGADDYRSSYIFAETTTKNTAYIAKGYEEGQIYSMRNCTATFRATVITDTTTAYFKPANMVLTYFIPKT